MENQKKIFFKKEENALDLFTKLDRNQMSKIVGSYSERTYAESTGTKKPKPPKLPKKFEDGIDMDSMTLEDYEDFEI